MTPNHNIIMACLIPRIKDGSVYPAQVKNISVHAYKVTIEKYSAIGSYHEAS